MKIEIARKVPNGFPGRPFVLDAGGDKRDIPPGWVIRGQDWKLITLKNDLDCRRVAELAGKFLRLRIQRVFFQGQTNCFGLAIVGRQPTTREITVIEAFRWERERESQAAKARLKAAAAGAGRN